MCNDTNKAWKLFETTLCSIIDKIAPKKLCRIKSSSKPWITSQIIENIKERDKCLRLFHSSKDQIHFQNFSRLRNETQRIIRNAKKDYILNQIESNKDNPKKIWDSLKLLGYQHKTKTKTQIVMNIDDSTCHDPVSIAEHINDFFINIGNNLVSKLPHLFDYYSAFTTYCRNFYSNLGITPGQLILQKVDESFVLKELLSMKPNKSTGLDDIGPRFLKDGAQILSPIITYLVNLSISRKCVPDCTKTAKVIPLFKKGSRLEVGNYRPVSILTSISKILERAVYIQVTNHCKLHNIIYPLQSGFQRKYSTDTCLIHLHDTIRSEISKGKFVGMMMLDVQKAFDSVNHEMLCEKIRLAGIDNMWFKSYLQHRNQTVDINNCLSERKEICCGVPQGSILGPWCYLIYSNDMPSCVDCTVILYADDTILLIANRSVEIVSKELSRAAETCYKWMTNNKLSMHRGKTEVVIFSSKRKKHLTKDFNITIDGNTIQPKDTVKYLGLKIDSDLSGTSAVDNIINKCTSRLKFFYRHKDSLNLKTKQTLACSLVQCHFDYAVSCWYMGLTKSCKKKLQTAQNKIVRFILDLGPRTHVGQNELDKVNCLNTKDRATQLILGHVFNIYHNLAPSYLSEKFSSISHNYNTRRAECNFFLQRPQGMEVNNFSYQGAKLWNELPSNIKKIRVKDSFKKMLKRHLRSESHAAELNVFMY